MCTSLWRRLKVLKDKKMNLNKYIVTKDTPILEAMNAINTNSKGIVYVCDGKKLVGALSDGNVRRHILSGGSLNESAGVVANLEPKFLRHGTNIDPNDYMRSCGIRSLPIVNECHEITSIKFIDDKSVYDYEKLDIPVVIMAGGKGTRLQPFTNVLPKPLIPIGEKTITERIMDCFSSFGCTDFNMVVNYKKELIKSYFSEIAEYNVSYFDEKEFLGTAGGLKYIEKSINSTFFMTNCDIIVDDNYCEILKHHKESNAIITMICTMKNYSIPYGTILVDDKGYVKSLEEKPNYSFLVNTGMYVIEPRFLDYIPENTFIHITDVIEKCIEAGETVSMYPISENAWMDMGEIDELEKMMKALL